MEEKIKKIMASVLGVKPEMINEDSSPETIENWDSLHHMNLIVALEQEFNVEFKDYQIVEMISFKLIELTLKELLDNK